MNICCFLSGLVAQRYNDPTNHTSLFQRLGFPLYDNPDHPYSR